MNPSPNPNPNPDPNPNPSPNPNPGQAAEADMKSKLAALLKSSVAVEKVRGRRRGYGLGVRNLGEG